VLVGGGYALSETSTDVVVVGLNGPNVDPDALHIWTVFAQRMGAGTESWSVRAYAMCADVS
jgi:hypothetical protein